MPEPRGEWMVLEGNLVEESTVVEVEIRESPGECWPYLPSFTTWVGDDDVDVLWDGVVFVGMHDTRPS